MKKKWLTSVVLALCIALVASLFTACGKKKVTIELSQTTLSLTVGDSATLTATTSNGKDVEWSSSDTKIATVSSRGGVTAQGAGTATITATCGKATATCSVTVTEKVVIGFTFTNAAGETLTEATVDRDGTLQPTRRRPTTARSPRGNLRTRASHRSARRVLSAAFSTARRISLSRPRRVRALSKSPSWITSKARSTR